MGCSNTKEEAARPLVKEERAKTEETIGLMEEGQPKLVKSEHEVKAKSGDKETQKILNKITRGEDFETNKWRCMSRPDQAYYTLSGFAKLEIDIIEARKLIPSITSSFEKYTGDEPDGFVKVYVDDTFKYSTHAINNNRSPKWNDPQTFDIVADLSMIRVHVFDLDGEPGSNLEDPIGFVEFCIADIPFDEEIDGWFELRFPNNLQGINTDRYFEHMHMREEEKRQSRPTEPPQKAKGNAQENPELEDSDVYMQSVAKVRSGMMGRALKRLNFMAGTGDNENPASDEQYNAGEIHLKLRLKRVVSDNTALFAKALVPSYMTYATFIQEEFLPKLDLQELLDDAMDIKIEVVDDMLFAVFAFFSYVLAWRSWLLSGLLFVSVVSGAKSSVLAYGFFHLWLALVMILLKFPTWRYSMTTNGMNAPLNQEGLVQVAKFNSTDEMHVYLIRMVQANCGTISEAGWQELVHFAGTVVQGDGDVDVTYDDLLKALKDLWFLDFPTGNPIEVGSLVRVNDRRRGTVTKVHHDDKVDVDYDEPTKTDPTDMSVKKAHAKDVAVRPYAPGIPRMLVPKSLRGLVTSIQFQVESVKKALLPATEALRAFFVWKRPVKMSLLIIYLVFRSYVSFYAYFFDKSWCHVAIVIMTWLRNAVFAILVLIVLFGQARLWKVLRAIGLMAAGKCCDRRQAPDKWKFYKHATEPYLKKTQ
mmetsp:Transcript_17448/g.41414  ORF Transcript_17448/g.41414 Transcript_17448/m.41414 type:complete len:702 (-) Transcript_17448:130-2235(-)